MADHYRVRGQALAFRAGTITVTGGSSLNHRPGRDGAVVGTLAVGSSLTIPVSADVWSSGAFTELDFAEASPLVVGSGSAIAPTASGVDDSDVLNALLVAGGRVVLCAGQVYRVRLTENPLFAGFYSGLRLPGNTHLEGNGATVKLIDGQAHDGSVVTNLHLDAATLDENLRVTNVIVDGNGANQAGRLHSGIEWTRVRGVHHYGVTVKNARGTASFPPGETFHITATLSSDLTYYGCEALGTAGTQGSGFGSNECTNVSRVNCLARGMSAGMGFADWRSRVISHANCIAQKCGANGFNAEFCERISWSSCHAGGRAPADDGTAVPFAPNETLGNGSVGFCVNETTGAEVAGCTSSYNASGVAVIRGASAADVQVSGGKFTNNTVGIEFNGNPGKNSSISPETLVRDNTSANFSLQNYAGNPGFVGGTGAPYRTLEGSPAVPVSATVVTNPFPFPMLVILAHTNTSVVIVNGNVNAGVTPAVLLGPGDTIQVNYSVAPTWIWYRA